MTRTTTTVTTSSAGGRQRRGTRRRAALTTLALAAGLGLLAAAPAAADTTTYADSVSDVGGSNHLPTLDILRYRLSLDASDFSLTVWSRATAADPIPGDARLAVDLAVDGDFRTSFQLRPTSASTWDVYAGGPVSSDRVCSAAGGVGIDTMTVTVPASCLGSPGKVAAKIDLSSTDGESFDRAPVQFLPLSGVLGIPVYFSPPVTAGPDLNPTTTPLVSVYRFWSPGFNNAHFFTTDEDEAVNTRAFDPNWRYEGAGVQRDRSATTRPARRGRRCSGSGRRRSSRTSTRSASRRRTRSSRTIATGPTRASPTAPTRRRAPARPAVPVLEPGLPQALLHGGPGRGRPHPGGRPQLAGRGHRVLRAPRQLTGAKSRGGRPAALSTPGGSTRSPRRPTRGR